MPLENKHLLITGATGFIGSALINRLRQENVQITAAVLKKKRSANIPLEVKQVIVDPLSDSSDYSEVLQNVDTVIHLAARVHIMQDNSSDPLRDFRKVNLYGTIRLAEQAYKAGVKRFVFISTIKVNGEETKSPYNSDSLPKPSEPYGISKWEAEQALRRIERETGLEVVVVRPTLVYGPGVKANFLKMMNFIQRGIPLPLASIHNLRSLIYVGNLVDVLAICASHPRAAGQTYLVSDGEDVSTPVLIQWVAKAFGMPARLIPFPPALMRVLGKLTGKTAAVDRLLGSLVVDSSKIRRELDWKPPFSMEEGLADTARWYKSISHVKS